MTPTPRLVGSAIVGVVALFLAVLVRRPEPAVVAAPFLVTAAAAWAGAGARPPRVAAAVVCHPERVVEGDEVALSVHLEVEERARVRVGLDLPPGLEVVDGSEAVELVTEPGRHELGWRLLTTDWGTGARVGVELVVTDLLGGTELHGDLRGPALKVLPAEQRLRALTAPRSLRSINGVHLSRQRGDGIEYVDSREFAAGDRARDVNWRVSARRDELWVDQRRPERSGEVVVFLDTFVSVGDSADNTLRRAVEVARAVADRHLGANDRVGLVDLGGVLRWVRPSGGTVQMYRIAETLVETEVWASGADKTVDVLPARALPRRCLVLAVSPLIDPRGVEAMRTLRARGFDVAVVEVSPEAFAAPPASAPDRSRLAHRLWNLDRAAVREQLRRDGIAVSVWRPGAPLEPVLDALGVFRTAVLRAAR
jgi:uncharacterized protein (DUF58 family)